MHSITKPLFTLGLVGCLASASRILSTPSLTTSVISSTSGAPLATGLATLNATQLVSHVDLNGAPDRDSVPHPRSRKDIALQRERAMDLVPVTYRCPDRKICIKGKKYLHQEVWEAVKNVEVSMEQVESSPLTIEVTITNKGTGPITFWNQFSPLSSYAFDLGYFLFHTDTPGVTFGEGSRDDNTSGYRPVYYSLLTEVEPGFSVSSRIKLPNNLLLKMLDMPGAVTTEMSGSWHGIWAGTKNEVMAGDVNDDMSFWNDIHIPWDAKVSKESQRYPSNFDTVMRLDLD
ncbi:hypothetical protein H9Q72_008308 [Fusarium xylarioides]|uniref:Uncharacterized protein n=1 Tax=Fusarium xylarioides TaxID=221167 RepID=A0A9P7HPV0_9HYPO|nr:hypothetical protein H9Q72_008308 [Fusarium xylarioides]